MRQMCSVVALWGFALVLGGCGGSGDGMGGRACHHEVSGTIVECVLFVGSDFVGDDDWIQRVCLTGSGIYKEGTSCPKTSSYVGHCLRFVGKSNEHHEYLYDLDDPDLIRDNLVHFYDSLEAYCAEDGDGVWVGRTQTW